MGDFIPPKDGKATAKSNTNTFVPPTDSVELKKKEELQPTSTPPKSGSGTPTGSSVGVNPAFKNTTPSPIPDFNSMQSGKSVVQKPQVKLQKPPVKEEDSFFDYLKDNLDAGITTVSKSFYDAPGLLYDAAAAITNPIIKGLTGYKGEGASSDKLAEDLGFRNIPSEILKEKIKVSNEKINAYSAKNGGDALQAIQDGNYVGAAKLVAGTTAQSLPIMVAAMASGGQTSALTAIGVSTASTKNAQLKEENPEMGLGTRVLNSANAGIIEAVTGHLFTGASGAVMKKIIADKGVEAGSKIIGKSFRTTIEKSIEKNPLVSAVGEVVEESAVEFGNQVNDMSSGIRTEFDFHAIKNAGLSATGMGGLQTLGVYGAKGYVKAKTYTKLKSNNKEVFKLRSEIESGNLSPENKAILSLRADRLEAENKKLLGTEIEKAKALPTEAKTELNALNSEFEDLKTKFDDIDDADDIPENLKPAMKEEIKLQASKNQKRKTEILSQNDALEVNDDFSKFEGVEPDFDLENGKISSLPLKEQNRLNKLAVEEITKGDKTIEYTKEQVSETANEIYKNEQTPTDEVSPEVADVEKRRKEELKDTLYRTKDFQEEQVLIKEINAKYDAELEALNQATPPVEDVVAPSIKNDKVKKTTEELEVKIPKDDQISIATSVLPIEGKINFSEIATGLGNPMSHYLNKPENLNKKARKIYDELKNGGKLDNETILLNDKNKLMDATHRTMARLALGQTEFDYAIAKKEFWTKSYSETISEAYHKAKLDGSNPKLVKSVEELLEALKTKETPKPQEVSPVEDVVAPSVEEKVAEIQKRRKNDIERYDESDKRGIEKINPDAESTKGSSIKVGTKWNDGYKAIINMSTADENYIGSDDPYIVISKIIKPAQFDESGIMTKAPEVDVMLFNTKEEADKFIKERLEKVKLSAGKRQQKANEKYDAEIKDVVKNEATPPTNTPTNGNVPSGASNVGESGITEQESPAKEGVSKPVDGGEGKGDASVGENNSTFVPKKETIKDDKGNPITFYHGSNNEFTDFDESMLGSFTGADSAKEGFFFTDNKGVANSYRQQAIYDAPNIEGLKEVLNGLSKEEIAKLGTQVLANRDEKYYYGDLTKQESIDDIIEDVVRDIEFESYYPDRNKFIEKISKILKEKDIIFKPYLDKGQIVETHLDIKNPKIIDADQEKAEDIGLTKMIKEAKEQGHDGIIIKNIYDSVSFEEKGNDTQLSTIVVVFDKKQINIKNKPAETPQPKAKGDVEVSDLDHAKDQIDKGVLLWSGDSGAERVNLGISWADIRKGEADIKRGKPETAPAKKLIEALKTAKEKGGYEYIQGRGGVINKQFVSLEDIQRSTNENNLTDAEQKHVDAHEVRLAKEYEAYFEALDIQTQNDIYENQEGINGLGKETTPSGESKNDVPNQEKPKSPTTKEKIAERIKLSDAKVDDVKAYIKGIDNIFGIKIKIDDVEGLNKNGIDFVEVIASIAKQAIAAGIHIDESINKTIEHFKGKYDFDVNIDDIKERINPKKEADNNTEGFKREKGKSSVLKRIREGGNSPEINAIIDKIGLNYEGRKQEQVYADGVNFVKEVGIAEAYNAIKNGELKDSDTINVVYATILQGFPKMAETEISKVTDPQELSDLVKELDDLHEKIYTEFKAKTIDAGRGSAILNFIYNQDLKIRYSLSQQIENFKKVNNGVVPAETLAKMKELDKQYQEANKRIEELETLLQEAQEQKDFENIVDEEKRNGDFKYTQEDFDKELQKYIDNIKNDIKNKKKSSANKKREDVLTPKEISRKQELRNKYFRANDITSIPALLVDPEFREYLGLVLKQAKGDFKIFSKEILDTLGKVAKTHLPDLFKEAQNEGSKKIGKLSVLEEGKISIPNSLIRSLVEAGYDNINKLTTKILEDNKAEFPDLTERNIRDAITKYGKTVEPNNVDPAPLIRKIKRAGKAISAIEDISKGIRPKRSGLQRDKLDPEERKILREINESMKNLPVDKADLSKHLKTALDAIKTRLSNHIEDLNKQIAEGKKWSKDKSSVELDQDAKDLVVKRDNLKTVLDDLVNVPKTEDEIYKERIASKLAEREKVLQGLIEGKKNDPTGRKSDWSAEISKVNSEISRLREKQKAIQSQKTPDEIYQKEVEAKINSLKKRIDDVKTGKVKDTEGNSSVWNNEISELETELKNLKKGNKVVNEPKVTVDDNGKVKIPTEMIKDFISKGGTDLSEFAKQVQGSIKDEFPDVSVREIRESVANYGKKANKSKPQIVEDIQKLKSEERLRLEYEDLQNRISKEKNEVKKRALTQTQKRLKEQIKQLQDDLGVTEVERTNRSVNYTKKRIEILREKIKNNDFAKKEIKPIIESQELKEAKIEKNRVQEEFDYLSYKQELDNRTFGDKALQLGSDLYDAQRVTLATGEASFVGAQGGLYMVNATFSRKTLKNLVENFKGTTAKEWKSNPFGTALKIAKSASSAEALIKMINTMGTANNYIDSQRLLKESPDYDLYLKMGIRLLGEDVKTQVKDDNFIGNNLLNLLRIPIHLTDRVEKSSLLKFKYTLANEAKKRTTLQGYYEKLKTGKISDKNKKTATEIFDNANPLAVFERGNNTFMNFARIDLANTYIAELRAQGKNPIDHLDDFKKVGSAINTITGSGNMNQTVTMALPVLNKAMFSARYFAASWNLTPPISLYYLWKLGNYDGIEINKPGTWKTLKPSVAQKAFVKPMVKGFLAMYGVSLATMALINAAIDDDDELTDEEKAKKRAYIEYDPRSSNFMQVNSGNTHTDFFGPYRGNVVFMSKVFSGQSKTKEGVIIENGSEYGSRTDFMIGAEYLAGKANPTLGVPLRYWQGKSEEVINEETGGKEKKRMLFGKEVGIGYQLKHNTYPIFVKTVQSVLDEDPVLGATFYNTLAFFGKNTNVYETKAEATQEEIFLKSQEKKKAQFDLPETEKQKIRVDDKLSRAESKIKMIDEIKIAQKMKLPYYISKDVYLTKEEVADMDLESGSKGIEEAKKEIKAIKLEYKIKD